MTADNDLSRRRLAAPPALAILATLLVLVAWPAPSRAASAATLVFKTVPRLPGVGLKLDGVTYRTNSSGMLFVPTVSGTHTVALVPTDALPGGRTARPDGWLGQRVLPTRITLRPGTNVESVSYIVSRPVTVIVTDHAGRQIPAGEIDRVSLSNSLGQRFTLPRGSSKLTLPLNGVVHPRTGYQSVPVRYTVRSVLVQGGEVVHRGGQTFAADAPVPWVIKALVFPLRIQARDALFHFAVGRSVVLAPSFGPRQTFTLGSGHEVRIEGLARGVYDITAHGPGIGLTSATILSRPQAAQVLLFSWIDIGVVLLFAAAFLVGLPLLSGRLTRGRGVGLLHWRDRRVPPARLAAEVRSQMRTATPLEPTPSGGSSGDSLEERPERRAS